MCRIRDNSVYDIVEERSLTDADRNARVLLDQLISLGSSSSKDKPNHPVRLVVIEAKLHKSKGRSGAGSTGQNCDGFLRIATNLMNFPVEIVALLYHYRWTIAISFRFFKHMLGCRHLLSHSQNGIEIQTYLRNHRVHTDQPEDWSKANTANLRNDLLVLLRDGG